MSSLIKERKHIHKTRGCKAILEFERDSEEHRRAMKALDMAKAIWDIGSYLRGVERYQEEPDDIERIREKYYEILEDYNINMEEILL